MFGLGWGELLIILLIVLAIFGTSRLAGIGGALGGGIRDFKKAVRDEDQVAAPKIDAPVVTRVDAPEKTDQKI